MAGSRLSSPLVIGPGQSSGQKVKSNPRTKQRRIPREGEARAIPAKKIQILKEPLISGATHSTCWKMDFFIYRTMDSFAYHIIDHWIVLDKRTTHASGTPPSNINTYYAYAIVYTFA